MKAGSPIKEVIARVQVGGNEGLYLVGGNKNPIQHLLLTYNVQGILPREKGVDWIREIMQTTNSRT